MYIHHNCDLYYTRSWTLYVFLMSACTRVARVSLFSAIDQSGVRNEFIDALPTLLSMACGQYSPQDSLLDFMGETIHEVEHIQKWENYNGKSRNNSEVKSMLISSPTKAAGIALQVELSYVIISILLLIIILSHFHACCLLA
jgi:hypothetical protein